MGEEVSNVIDNRKGFDGVVRVHVESPIGGIHIIFANEDLFLWVFEAHSMKMVKDAAYALSINALIEFVCDMLFVEGSARDARERAIVDRAIFSILFPRGSRVGWTAFPMGMTLQCGICGRDEVSIGIMKAWLTSLA